MSQAADCIFHAVESQVVVLLGIFLLQHVQKTNGCVRQGLGRQEGVIGREELESN